MASINDLDNPLLVLILNRLCIQKLFTAGHVCVRWNAMRDMSVSERKELLLMVGNDAKRYIEESGFQIPEKQLLVDENGDVMFRDQSDLQLPIHTFQLDFVRFLLTHFTNLTTLTISVEINSNEFDSIIHLLEQFNRLNGTLQTLKLYSNHDQRNNEWNNNIGAHLRLLSTVNSIGSLRKLTFDVNTKFVINSKFPRIDLPILSQLDEFEFNSADEFSCLYDSITIYAVNNQGLRRIGIHYSTRDFTWLLELPHHLSSHFTHLNVLLYSVNSIHFEDLCRNFANLTSLEISVEFCSYTIYTLLHPLTHLPNLISLLINIEDRDILRVTDRGEREIQFALPSVKVLTINYKGLHENHHFFDKCNMSLVLPNVQVVRIIRERSLCNSCSKKLMARTETLADLEENCARQMFRNFAHSQHLSMVCSIVTGRHFDILGPRNRLWEWNEIGSFKEKKKYEEDWEVDDYDRFE